MAHDQQAGSQDTRPDARVAAAAAHWGNRFTSNGTDYGDFAATLARITSWADWCREWGVTATHYEQLAEAAEDAGQSQTAVGAWQRERDGHLSAVGQRSRSVGQRLGGYQHRRGQVGVGRLPAQLADG